MDPIKSKYQWDPWTPNVDPNSSDTGDEQSAADKYNAIYGGSETTDPTSTGPTSTDPVVTMPTLTMSYTEAPDLLPIVGAASSSPTAPSSVGKAPEVGGTPASPTAGVTCQSFTVDLGALRTVEQSFLDATSTAISGYEDLKSRVTSAIDDQFLFGQYSGEWLMFNADVGNVWHADPLNQEGDDFAKSIGPQMSRVLRDVAGMLEAVGEFTAALNNAGQLYAQTDVNSLMPPAGMNRADQSGASRTMRLPD